MESTILVRFASVATFAALAFASTAFAQRATQPAVQQPQSRQGDSTESNSAQSTEASPTLSDPDSKIHAQSLKTKSVATTDDCTDIIDTIQEGIDAGATPRYAAYGRKLKAWAHNRRGEMLAKDGKEADALKDFEAAVVLDPLLWKAVQNRGVSKGMAGDKAAALADFNRVIELNPEYANAWFNRANLRVEQRELAGALQDFNQAIRIQPNESVFYSSRGHILYQLGRMREAISDYDRAVQLNPNEAATLVDRADVHRETRQYNLAANDYVAAYRLDPKLSRAYLGAAWQMATCPQARFRNAEMGIEIAKKAIEIGGETDYRWPDTLAAAYANAGQFAEAKEAAARALAIAPEKVRPEVEKRIKIYERGLAYREGGPPEAVRAASRTQQ
jgi:tetratricopeptide (TPR) repeat protein